MQNKSAENGMFKDKRLWNVSIKVSSTNMLTDRQIYYSIYEIIENELDKQNKPLLLTN